MIVRTRQVMRSPGPGGGLGEFNGKSPLHGVGEEGGFLSFIARPVDGSAARNVREIREILMTMEREWRVGSNKIGLAVGMSYLNMKSDVIPDMKILCEQLRIGRGDMGDFDAIADPNTLEYKAKAGRLNVRIVIESLQAMMKNARVESLSDEGLEALSKVLAEVGKVVTFKKGEWDMRPVPEPEMFNEQLANVFMTLNARRKDGEGQVQA